jgi:hypothetical protein
LGGGGLKWTRTRLFYQADSTDVHVG